jgi:hypothetical protein
MRRILIDAARRKKAEKRGGGCTRVGRDGASLPAGDSPFDLLELDDLLDHLATAGPGVTAPRRASGCSRSPL